ncbi:DUF2817 domain-containing protein [Pseudooceanicola marinus]|uniref:DUF2817 domain-containing protein n=1 Tax=Pseudooceanicola marinus TaxID=396013 RepID=UPI001CD44303|nr:DUF2817 domain-containing protein [Pseudooceanicola marinus]MCA1337488.1 M14 family metallopeptidase [Pseudooceanicola marinus]
MSRRIADDYNDARERFLSAANHAGASLTSYAHPLHGPSGEPLATDVARLGPAGCKKVLILESSLHGVEGYAGSAVQVEALKQICLDPDGELALLLVHAINPWGFAHERRFNEDNIDLNRHFIDWDNPGTLENEGYDEIADVLIPDGPDAEALARSDAGLEAFRAHRGDEALKQAIKLGQYAHPEGLYYGGLRPSWSARTVARIVQDHLTGARIAGLIDVHTGLGPFGFGECLSGAAPDSEEGRRASAWYGQVAHTKDPKTGYAGSKASILDGYRRAGPDLQWTPIGLEFGTRAPDVVRDAVRFDGWLHLNGGLANPQAGMVKAKMRDAYCPAEPDWAEAIVDRGIEVVTQGLAAIAAQPEPDGAEARSA